MYRMISLCQADAAFRRVRHYNPDIDIELLFRNEAEIDAEDLCEIAHTKSALVARVADIGVSENARMSQITIG